MLQLNSEVKPNYYALCICVLSERIPEEAFRIMGVSESMKFNETDADGIWEYKKNHTWQQVGDQYGVSGDAIRRRVIRLREQKGRN